ERDRSHRCQEQTECAGDGGENADCSGLVTHGKINIVIALHMVTVFQNIRDVSNGLVDVVCSINFDIDGLQVVNAEQLLLSNGERQKYLVVLVLEKCTASWSDHTNNTQR